MKQRMELAKPSVCSGSRFNSPFTSGLWSSFALLYSLSKYCSISGSGYTSFLLVPAAEGCSCTNTRRENTTTPSTFMVFNAGILAWFCQLAYRLQVFWAPAVLYPPLYSQEEFDHMQLTGPQFAQGGPAHTTLNHTRFHLAEAVAGTGSLAVLESKRPGIVRHSRWT